jgi:hypothetical protein
VGGFTWAATADGVALLAEGADDVGQLGRFVAERLTTGARVALAWESPLAIPVPSHDYDDSWGELGRARSGEGNRSWSAGAGAGVLATGLAQLAWLCGALAAGAPDLSVTTQPRAFLDGQATLLLAEALVSADGKPEPVDGHQDKADAVAAAKRLHELLVSHGALSDVRCSPHVALNLAAAAALHAGLSIDREELRLDVLVAKARPV